MSTPQPPITNLRDLSTCSSPPLLHPNVILRSAIPPSSPSPALTALNVSTVFDLRSNVEIGHATVGVTDSSAAQAWTPSGPARVHVPVFADADYGPEAIALRFKEYASQDTTKGFAAAYRGILQNGAPAYRTILLHLASPEWERGHGPVLVHCTAGKDRTGVICAIVLMLCGVPDEDIVADYARTEDGLRDWKPTMLARLSQMPAFKDDPEGASRMLSAKPESMIATLEMIRDEWGSVEDYVINDCGLTKDDIARIRNKLLIDDTGSHKPAL